MSKRKKKSKKRSSGHPCWFLDTSVFINRFFGHPRLKQDIKQTIHTIPCYTSFFVSYEFKRSVIRTLIEWYYLVKEEGPADALYTYKESFKPRENSIIVGAIASLLARGDVSSSKLKALSSLEALILSSLQDFQSMVKEFVENKTKCPLAKASITTGSPDFADFMEQTKCKAVCTVSKFWKSQKGVLKVLASCNDEYKKNNGFRKMLPVLHEVLKDPDRGQMISNCAKLGDVIIAIEMPAKCTMLTYDKSYESLCPLLGKEVYRLPSLSELKRRTAQA